MGSLSSLLCMVTRLVSKMKTALSIRKAIEIRYLFTKAQQETGIGIISQVPWQWRGGVFGRVEIKRIGDPWEKSLAP